MILSIEELRRRVAPVAEKYQLPAVYLFGSYARGDATDHSDVDILIDRSGSRIRGMLDMGSLYTDLRDEVGKEIDLVTTQTLEQRSTSERTPEFVESVRAEMRRII